MRRGRFCRYGGIWQKSLKYLAKFLELSNGIPDRDTFRRLFEKIKRGTVAIDGKTICGSGNNDHKAYHVISAFVAENQLH